MNMLYICQYMLWKKIFFNVCVLVNIFVHERASLTKAPMNRTEIWQAGWGRNLSLRRAALLSCVHPAVRIMFGTPAQAPGHPRPAERRKNTDPF